MAGNWCKLRPLSGWGARERFVAAMALVIVIPTLTGLYLIVSEGMGGILVRTAIVLLGLVLPVGFGYMLLRSYPDNIVRLRSYLEDIVDGRFPEQVSLIKGVDDIQSIETAMNWIVNELGVRVRKKEEELARVEWLLGRHVTPTFWRDASRQKQSWPHAAPDRDNSRRVILDGVGQEMLSDIMGDLMDLLETAAVIYEDNGDVALDFVVSEWYRVLYRNASPDACAGAAGDDICPWSKTARRAMDEGVPIDSPCVGDTSLYFAPIFVGDKVVGAAGFAYGDPPESQEDVQRFAELLNVSVDEVRLKAAGYERRPPFIVSVAKNRLLTCAKLIGEVIERRQAEVVLRQSEEDLREHRAHLEEIVEQRTAELQAANEHLKREIQERHRAEKLKDDFVSTVSHELRTPLSIVKEGIALMLDGITGEVNEKQRKVLLTSQSNIDRLARIINDLLDVSKMEAGRMEITREAVDLAEIVSQAVANLNPLAKKKDLYLNTELPGCRLDAYADSGRLTQVLTNLISNAIKFTREGGVTVQARESDGVIECVVRDTGIGIAEEDIPRLFRKFVQINRENGAGRRGTGLGLAIAKNIIELHGGYIRVESTVDEGTMFTFVIPCFTLQEVAKERVNTTIADARENHESFSVFQIRVEFDEAKWPEFGAALARSGLNGLINAHSVVRGTDDVFALDERSVIVLAQIEPKYVAVMYRRWLEKISALAREEGNGAEITPLFSQAHWPTDGQNGEELVQETSTRLKEYKPHV